MIQAYAYGVLIAAASAVVVVGQGMLLAGAVVNLGSMGVVLVAVLYFVGDNLLGYYMISRDLGIVNTIAGVVFQNMYLIAPVALVSAFILKQDYSVFRILKVTASVLGLAFAWFWGDHMSALVSLRSTEKYPISVVMYQASHAQGTDAGKLTAILYILVPILVAGACIVISSSERGEREAA